MRYTDFFPCSLFPEPRYAAPYSLLPTPCSLKPSILYLTTLIIAILNFAQRYFPILNLKQM
ncbi:hypothetical protein BJP36_39135 [Moorena producens JHB]|uniref:Uncharacterized protein n=1 Tax=Moorena producens (strain JHB) TaxID=1454205 RepID=A0A9Q9SUU2_MOOP1|nr:hypothetical protein [Moorena producens]WAN70079.1 hypothetical protein BJP36_39135 [Moorena producens JHB]